jgi:hypothetical protein
VPRQAAPSLPPRIRFALAPPQGPSSSLPAALSATMRSAISRAHHPVSPVSTPCGSPSVLVPSRGKLRAPGYTISPCLNYMAPRMLTSYSFYSQLLQMVQYGPKKLVTSTDPSFRMSLVYPRAATIRGIYLAIAGSLGLVPLELGL